MPVVSFKRDFHTYLQQINTSATTYSTLHSVYQTYQQKLAKTNFVALTGLILTYPQVFSSEVEQLPALYSKLIRYCTEQAETIDLGVLKELHRQLRRLSTELVRMDLNIPYQSNAKQKAASSLAALPDRLSLSQVQEWQSALLAVLEQRDPAFAHRELLAFEANSSMSTETQENCLEESIHLRSGTR